MQALKVSFVLGTRPEAIKLAPVILAMRRDAAFQPHVCATGQHRQMLGQVLDIFKLTPDVDLDLMRPDQTLGGLTSRAVAALDEYMRAQKPDLVLVQGDTTTVFCAALAAFYHRRPVGHVEAGLRTWNRYSPFPEEINRVMTSRLAEYHFAPTEGAAENLVAEGISQEKITVTGNTVIDALHLAVEMVRKDPPEIPVVGEMLMRREPERPVVLITGHRRENFGAGFESICRAITALAERHRDVAFVYPVHLNPNVRQPVFSMLGSLDNIFLLEPLDYLQFVAMMNRSKVILTDSGGVQEEAPSLGKPVLVMRDTTERPEGVEAGTVRLVGCDKGAIVDAVTTLLTDSSAYAAMATARNPYGDGLASQRILEACRGAFQ